MKQRLIFALLAISVLSCNSNKFKADSMHWLQFRGPNASGIAPESADPPIIFSNDTNLLWKTPVISGWSSPCVVNDRIFLNGFNESDSMLHTMAFNRESGKLLWSDSVKARKYPEIHPVNSYATKTIASDGERIYSAFTRYGMISYDLEGNKIWEYKKSLDVDGSFYGGSTSPIVIDSIVLTLITAGKDKRLQALDCQSGDTAWSIREKKHEWGKFNLKATPVAGNDLLILHLQYHLVAYDLNKRTAIWWMSVPNAGVATPVIHDNVISLNSWNHVGEKTLGEHYTEFPTFLNVYDKNGNQKIELLEIPGDKYWFQRPESPDEPMTSREMNDPDMFEYVDKNKDGSINEKEWDAFYAQNAPSYLEHGMYALPLKGEGNRSEDELLWKINEDTPEVPSPLIVNNDVFFIKNGGIISVINRESGEVVYKNRIAKSGTFLSSPMLAANRIYACSFNGTVSVLSADDYSVLAQNKLKEKIGASPVAVNDVLYLRTDKFLYAFREQ